MHIIKYKGRRGIDDLKPMYAFMSTDQGGGMTNSIDTYKESKGWYRFIFDCDIEQEAIANQIVHNAQYNLNYVTKLLKEGKFGDEYSIGMTMQPSPFYDKVNGLENKPTGLASYKMVFLDFKK